jgi:hypothetical protein
MKTRRGVTVLLASLVTMVTTLVATAAPASADFASLPTNTPLRIFNYNSIKCMQPVAGNGVAAWDVGAPIQQLPCGTNTPNYWTVQYVGEASTGACSWWEVAWCVDTFPVYQFHNVLSGKCLAVAGSSMATWAPTTQVNCTPAYGNTLWMTFTGDYNGTVIIENFNSFLCLDVYGASTETGAGLQQWTCTSHNVAQNFYYMS